MIKLRFHNSIGEVSFEAGKWHLTAAEGLTLPQKLISAVRYINQPGQKVTSCVEKARTITLSGDVNLKILGIGEISRACSILGKEGILTVETERFVRRINARCIEFVPGDRKGHYRTFVVQFLCDIPFFEDEEYTTTAIYKKIPKLSRDTVLPAVFSERIAKGDIHYTGSAYAEPIIYLDMPEGSGLLEIINRTTGNSIKLSYDSSLYKKLIIDTKERRITDENGTDRVEILTDDSFFDGFCIVAGENIIEVINSDQIADVTVLLKYKVRYLEAVV